MSTFFTMARNLLCVTAARAELPLPSYRDELAKERAAVVNRMLEENCAWERFLASMVCRPGVVEAAVDRVAVGGERPDVVEPRERELA